ncbi:MAG TPA: CpsB/CapC family capsule biosynthesis tyrosine phosphatase [Longimicrobium sp.]|nr:CpsB/CapC family capsule biosynthesis tyrosine phosphatase [Longimicrobium sp.]
MIDFHNHVIPGVDDGAADVAQSLAALETMRAQGAETVIATPHVNGADTRDAETRERVLGEIDAGWEALKAAAPDAPRLERGAEVMLDVPALDLADPRLRLAGTRFVLVEFPYMSVPPNGTQALFDLKMQGWTPVLAHPERYANLSPAMDEADDWRRSGALLQVNAASLLGRYGDVARKAAWGLVERGWASYLCSDYHARGRYPVAEAVEALKQAGASEQAELLFRHNPARLLAGEAPLPVPPVFRRTPLWRRVLGMGRG